MEYDFRRKATPVLIGLLLLLTSTFAFGQGIVTGSISGTVQDQQQAVVSGAKVTVKDNSTNQEQNTETNTVGFFTVRSLTVGAYTVTIEAPKFQKLRLNNVPVSVGRDTNLGAKTLTIGAEEVVNVESTPPLVETQTISHQGTFAPRQVTDLPIGVGFDALQLFVPGAVSAGNIGFGNSNGSQASVNGNRTRSNNFQIDGQDNNDNTVTGPGFFFSNADVIAEYQVITNYTAEYGRNTGSQVNYVTKSGTNAFHGTAFEYNQNSWLDSLANQEKNQEFGFCAPGADPNGPDGIPGNADDCSEIGPVPQYNENRFGFTFGGPVVKDKLFFFTSGFWDRIRVPGGNQSTAPARTPTPAGLATLAAAFPGNTAVNVLQTTGPTAISLGNPEYVNAVTRFVDDSTAVNCNPVQPLPPAPPIPIPATCVAVEFAQVQRFVSSPYSEEEFSFRGDWNLTSKDRIFGSYLFEDSYNGGAIGAPSFGAGYWVDVPARSQQGRIDWTRTFSSRFVNQARVSYTRLFVAFEGGSTGCTSSTITTCASRIIFSDATTNQGFGVETNFPQNRLVNHTQFQDNASLVVGNHTFKFGGSYGRQRSPAVFLPNVNGSFTFANFNSFLANVTTGAAVTDGDIASRLKEQDFAFYFQDDWRIKSNLTLNLGLRYEWFQQAINSLHRSSLARQTGSDPLWDPALDLAITTIPEVPEDKNNFAPSIGFAWQPRFWEPLFGKDKTTIRAGFRISYDPAYYNIALNMFTAAPNANSVSFTAALGAVPNLPNVPLLVGDAVRPILLALAPTGSSCVPITLCNPGYRSYVTVSPDFRNPYSQQWNFSIQREITPKIAAEVRYVGNHGVALFRSVNANPSLGHIRLAGTDAILGNANDSPAIGAIGLGFDGTNPNRLDIIPDGVTGCLDNGPNGVFNFTSGSAGSTGDDPPGRLNQHVDCRFRNITQRNNSAFSIYHGLQSKLEVRNWHGITSTVAYTFSRTIDDTSEVFSDTSVGAQSIRANPFDNLPERGQSAISFPHVLAMTLIYDYPFFKNQSGVLGRFLGGWSTNLTYRYNSGAPWTVRQTQKTALGLTGANLPFSNFAEGICDPTSLFSTASTTCRPIVSNPSAPFGEIGICLDETAADCGLVDWEDFAPTTFDQVHFIINNNASAIFFGSPFLGTSRNTERGDTINTVNLSFYKTTKITERVNVQFQAVVFNVLNHQFLGQPLTSVNFGEGVFNSTASNFNGDLSVNSVENGIDRRRFQFGLKVIF